MGWKNSHDGFAFADFGCIFEFEHGGLGQRAFQKPCPAVWNLLLGICIMARKQVTGFRDALQRMGFDVSCLHDTDETLKKRINDGDNLYFIDDLKNGKSWMLGKSLIEVFENHRIDEKLNGDYTIIGGGDEWESKITCTSSNEKNLPLKRNLKNTVTVRMALGKA